MYDFVIVGSGLFGSTFAYEMKRIGKKCLVIESREHIGGNCYTENKNGINIHKYGAHIFHTNDKKIWEWILQFAEFNSYRHTVKVSFKNDMYSFPINLMTLNKLWGVNTPLEAVEKLKQVRVDIKNVNNIEDFSLSEVGPEIYNIFIKGYTEKQWGTDAKNLPSSIIKRIPIRTNFDDGYFNDKYQGIPNGGYTQIFEKLLNGVEVRLNTNFFENREYFESICNKIVFTGKIDEFFNYQFGKLDYRSLRFENKTIEMEDYQGCSVVNFTDRNVPFTRIIEHKHFESHTKTPFTVITKEYPEKFNQKNIPYYPINDKTNSDIFLKYRYLSERYPNIIFGGRLAEYKYYDMHQIIASALKKVEYQNKILNEG